jgi:O-methyltransferase involved in polyketide biosynthesis
LAVAGASDRRVAKVDFQNNISASAFLVNESRARRRGMSLDRYAEQWVLPEQREQIAKLWDDFSAQVYPFDDVVLSMRNRFFLDRLQAFVNIHAEPALVNLGAGFTSYPFLLDRSIRVLEADLPHVTAYKKLRISSLKEAGLLPVRTIEFCDVNLTYPDELVRFERAVRATLEGRPSFILMEGLTYYLDPTLLNKLFEVFSKYQSVGSLVALDYWEPELAEQPVFVRLRQFFERQLGHAPCDYNLFDERYVRTRPGYEAAELSDVIQQEAGVLGTTTLRPEEILFEHYAILMRI